jgi:hypothetical protein
MVLDVAASVLAKVQPAQADPLVLGGTLLALALYAIMLSLLAARRR